MGLWGSKDERAEASATDAEKNEFHKLLQECQGLTKDLVRDVVDLLRSLDLMLPTTQILKDNLTIGVDKMDHGSTGEIFHLEKCQRAALQLLLATEGLQLCQKQGTMNTLDRLLQFIKKLVQMEFECKPGSFGEDLLEGYMKGTETTKTIEDIPSDAPETLKSDHKKKKKTDLLKDIIHLEKTNSELKQKVFRLEKKDASFYSEKKILNESITKLEIQLKCAEKKFQDMPNDLANTCAPEDQLQQLSSKLIEAEDKTSVLNKKIDSLNEENGRLNSQLISVDIEKANLETELANLEKEKEISIIEMDNDKRQNEEQRIKFAEEIDNLERKLIDTETRTTALAEECEQLKECKRILEKEKDEDAKRNKSLETELKQKSEEHKVLCEQNDEKIKGHNKTETKLNELMKEREENATLIKTLQKANDIFDSVIVKSEREKDEIKKERANEKKHEEDLRITLTEEIGDLKQKIQDTETRIKTSIEERERLKEANRILEKERDEEAQKVKHIEFKLTQKSEEHKEICEQKDERIKELNEMKTKLYAIIKEREEEKAELMKTLQKANENFNIAIVNLGREKDAIKNERAEEKKRNEELRIKLTEEICDLKQKIQDTETRIKTSIAERKRLKEETRTLEKERDAEAQKVMQTEIKLLQTSEERKEICEQRDEKVKELNEMETKFKAIIKKREEERVELIKTFQKANDNFDSVMVKLEREKDEIKKERTNEKKRDGELRTKLAKEIGDLKDKIQDTEIRIKTLIEERERLKEENRTLEKERDEDAQRIKCLETELKQNSDDYKVSNEQKDSKIKELVSTQIKLHANVTKKEVEHAQLSKTLQNANDNFDKLMKRFDTEKERLDWERNEETTQKEELKIQLANTIDNSKQQLQQKEMKICDLTVVQEKMKSKEIEYQSCLQGKEEKINELENLNKTMQKQQLQEKEDYDNKNMSLENENQRVQRQLEMLRVDLKAKSESEKKLLKEAEVLTADLLDKKGHIERINNQYENTKLQLTNEISALTDAQLKEKNTMESLERKRVSELQNVRSANKTLNDQICKEQHARKENENLITGLKEQLTHIEEEKTKLRTRLTKTAHDLENCTAEKEKMKNELEKIRSRKVIQIQMYSQSGVGLLSSVEDELKCVLKSQMDVEESVDVDIIICAKASDIQPEIPLLILCIQASRLGTAVASTVQGLTLTPKMAVLIFHHKDVHALPNQASERVLTGQELRSLGGIFDLAFLSGKGIYPCEMNRSNFISLINFIKREGTKRIRDDL